MRTIIALMVVAAMGCKPNQKTSSNASAQPAKTETKNQASVIAPSVPGPHAMVYKTKADYNNLIPVELSDDKTKIVSYPGRQDIVSSDGYQTPTPLHQGYLLDNRGIGKNVAFIKMTYPEYSKLVAEPSVGELYNMIIEKDPLTELVDCGSKIAFKDIINDLNKTIDENKLRSTCKVIK